MTIQESVKDATTKYGDMASDLAIGLSIEMFKDIRHYPSDFDSDRIDEDMRKNLNKIAMAAVEIESKNGVENQIGHSENGMNRSYYQGILAYKDVLAIAHLGS